MKLVLKEVLRNLFFFICVLSIFHMMITYDKFRKREIFYKQISESWNQTQNLLNGHLEYWDFSEEAILKRTQNCSAYFYVIPAIFQNPDIYEFERDVLSDDVDAIAYNILVHSQPGIVELFLALYFRPSDHYVFHLDAKASDKTRKVFSSIINCYSNEIRSGSISLVPKDESVSIEWGTSSILRANLLVYRKLLEINQNSPNKWSHVISNAGSELPISSYLSFRLKIKQNLNATESALETFPIPEGNFWRVSSEMRKNCIKDSCNSSPHLFQLPNPLKPEQNYTFQVYKGTHINSVISYKDVEFVANSTISKAYYSWVKNMVASAEEHHSPTLLRLRINSSNDISQDVEGTEQQYYRGICPKYVNWYPESTCKGEWIHTVCNFGVGDLERVQASSCLFANKFNLDVDKNAVLYHFLHVLNQTINERYTSQNYDITAS